MTNASLASPDRLAALHRTRLLDSPAEVPFDRVTELACRLLGVPVSAVSLVTPERQFFKSQQGIPEPWASQRETPLSHSFCQYVVAADAPLVVVDARAHALVQDNLAIPDLGVESYLGVPVRSQSGHTLGALCAIEGKPRVWTDADRETLECLAAIVETEIALRAELRERVQAEVALTASEARFRLIAETSSSVIVSTDDAGTVLYANPALDALFGYHPSHLVGRPLAHLMPERLRAAHRAGLARYVATGERRLRWDLLESVGLHASGTEFPVSISFGEYESEGVRCFSGIIRDISAQKAAEAALIEAREAAEATSRLKSALLSNMSHEIRTPLTAVLGYAEILCEEVSPDLKNVVAAIERAGERLLVTLNSLLDLAQIAGDAFELAPAPVHLADVARRVCERAAPGARARGLGLALRGEPAQAFVDPEAVVRVVEHLVDNAVKFTESGSIAVTVGIDDGQGIVRVADTGVGIEASFLPRIFGDFEQESDGHHRSYEGSGLGLAVAHRLARLMGGDIEVESEKGAGSTFTLRLPLAAASDGRLVVPGAVAHAT